MHMEGRLQVFSGNANLALAKEISACLNMNLGRALVTTFKNGEIVGQDMMHYTSNGAEALVRSPGDRVFGR